MTRGNRSQGTCTERGIPILWFEVTPGQRLSEKSDASSVKPSSLISIDSGAVTIPKPGIDGKRSVFIVRDAENFDRIDQ